MHWAEAIVIGKNPAFQFYPSDWCRDLEEHPLEIEGAWIRICCKLWWSDTRGKLSRTIDQWAKILRIDQGKAFEIIQYIATEKIGNVEINGALGFSLGFPSPNDFITVISRRMLADERDRNLNTLRQRKWYDKHKPNASLTATSQDSSSSSSSSGIDNINIISCPHKEIVQTYNDVLGHVLTPVKYDLWQGSERAKYLQVRWKGNEKYQNIDFWKGFFEYIRDKCPFLIGETKPPFRADLEWIITKRNFIKILEGKYEKRT